MPVVVRRAIAREVTGGEQVVGHARGAAVEQADAERLFERAERGTRVTLHLKEDEGEFLEP